MEETTASTETLILIDSLPFDLVVEILCRLPVKFLLRFRCVCKSWNSLISNDPKFTKKHLHMMSTTKRRHLVTTTTIMAEELTIMSYPFDSLELDSIFNSNPTQLDYSPIITSSAQNGLIASCDGLLCLVIDQHLAVLYNPCIRKVKKLPSLDLPREKGSTIFSFGYDPFIDNYKVVSVFCYGHPRTYNSAFKTEVKVHTLGSDSWRRIKDFPSMFRCGLHGVFVSGTVNWLTCSSSSCYDLCAIVSLHLGKESYQEIPHPDSGDFDMSTLDTMRECLCIFSRKRTDSSDVWLMKEYGNKDSWIKLISFSYFNDHGYTPYINIVHIYEDGNHMVLILRADHGIKWVVYDYKNDTIKKSLLNWVIPKVYVESLISP